MKKKYEEEEKIQVNFILLLEITKTQVEKNDQVLLR